EEHVFNVKHDVVGGERRAIRPLHAFAEVECVLASVVADFPAFSNIWLDAREIRLPDRQVFPACDEPDATPARVCTNKAEAERAAIFAWLDQRFNNSRIQRYTLVNWW